MLYLKHFRSIKFIPITFEKYLILDQHIWTMWFRAQNIHTVSYLYRKHGKDIVFLTKIFEKYRILNQNIQNAHVRTSNRYVKKYNVSNQTVLNESRIIVENLKLKKCFKLPQEFILCILESLQTSKIEIFSKFRFFRIFHTTQYCATLRWFVTSKIQNPFTKWSRNDEKIKHISKFFKYLERSQSSKIEISTKLQFSKVSHTLDLAILGSFLA